MRPAARSKRRALLYRVTLVVLLMGAAQWASAQLLPKSAGSAALAKSAGSAGSAESAALPDAPEPQVSPGTQNAAPAAAGKKCAGASQARGPQKKAGRGCGRGFDFFHPLGRPPSNGPLTPKNKLQLAAGNVVDPFNLITIGGTAAITIGSNPDTDYGPGLKGWAKNAGTLLTEDMTGEFFATFLVPSLARQDPRYYRMPKASIPRRIVHAIVQPVWTKSDKGNLMPNFGSLIGVPAAITLANVYVPGRQQGAGPTAESSAIAIGTAPIDNFISEFLPDVAKHISIHIVFIQRIVNQIALTRGPV